MKFKTVIQGVVLTMATSIAASSVAAAATVCKDRKAALEVLQAKYSEAPVAMGVDASGRLLEVLATEDGKTWTIMVTKPGGDSCIVATGEGWVWRELKSLDPEA